MKTIKVFVYGTLIVGESNHHVAQPFLVSHEDGIVKGHLYSCGGYPAIVLDENGQDIKGQWFTIKEEGLANMDRLEGFLCPGSRYNLYERVEVKDAYKEEKGFIYVFDNEKVEDRQLPLIECGSWVKFNNERKSKLKIF